MKSESKIINLFTEGEVKSKDKTFTRLVGGFGDNKPSITDKQVAELLGYAKGARSVREQITNNIKYFKFGIDIIDLQRVDEKDTLAKTLETLGYAKQSITQAKNIYIFSEAGFLLFLKFAEGDKAVELYKEFIEDYFKTKAENVIMKKSIEDEIKELNEDKKYYIGATVIEKDEIKKMEYQTKLENINNRITELEKTKSKKEVISQYEQEIGLAEKIYNSKSFYDMGRFAKILDTKGLGRNKLFEWLRNKKILRSNNEPYQAYMDYFKLIPIERNGYMDYKTTVKPLGVKYIVNKLNKDNKIVLKSVDDILKELEESENIGA